MNGEILPQEPEKPMYIPATLEDVARDIRAIRASLDRQASLPNLVKELRKLAAEASRTIYPEGNVIGYCERGRAAGLKQAAQMIEELQ